MEVESVFGQIKQSRGYTRFLLRGLKKVEIELGLVSMAHNFLKWHQKRLAELWPWLAAALRRPIRPQEIRSGVRSLNCQNIFSQRAAPLAAA